MTDREAIRRLAETVRDLVESWLDSVKDLDAIISDLSEPAAPTVTREQAQRVVDLLFLALDDTVRRANGYADKGMANYWGPLCDLFCKDRKAFFRAVADALEGE